jgi:uncharacterized protein (DUF302 family)
MIPALNANMNVSTALPRRISIYEEEEIAQDAENTITKTMKEAASG